MAYDKARAAYDKVTYDKMAYDKARAAYDKVTYDKMAYDKVAWLEIFVMPYTLHYRCYASAGIDLGTTNSAIAARVASRHVILINSSRSRLTPSVVSINKEGSFVVGDLAKRQAVVNPLNTYFSLKSLIGRPFDQVTNIASSLPYQITRARNGFTHIYSPYLDAHFYPEQLSAKVVEALSESHQMALESNPECGVITVPAYFDDTQRNATKDAGTLAQFPVKRIINEPTAAALAYGFDKSENVLIFVFDAGGGTFDVSLLEAGDGVFEVVKTGGDSELGGDRIDQKIAEWLVRGFQKRYGNALGADPRTMQRLKEASEKAKLELSSSAKASINLPFIADDQGKPRHLSVEVTRDTLRELMTELVQRFRRPMVGVLTEARLNPTDIDHVILVGGTTRIPLVQELVEDVMKKKPNCDINPDEVVAIGASIQAEVLSGGASDVILIDVTPLSLGIETLGGINTRLIPRNTSLPTSKTEMFSTAVDNQPGVEINVLQGEREMAADCKPIGTFKLSGIRPAPRGVPQISVSFQIDVDGILKVSANESSSGVGNDLEIRDSIRRTQQEIDQMIREAEQYVQQDQTAKELVASKNEAEAIMYESEKILQEDEGAEDNREAINKIRELIQTLRSALNGTDADVIREISRTLSQAVAAYRK